MDEVKITDSRRTFIKQSSVGLCGTLLAITNPLTCSDTDAVDIVKPKKLPKDICVASINLSGLLNIPKFTSQINRILERMEEVAGMHPDIVCLPELFNTKWVNEKKSLSDIAEDIMAPGQVISRMAAFARKNNLYVVCPLITTKEGLFYNSSLLIDRKGKIAGVYNQIHPTKTQIVSNKANKGGGIVPGAINQPIFETDFGKVGMQMGLDANWPEGWAKLKKKKADIVLYPSTFSGGRMLNYYALKNNYYILTSTTRESRVIDMSGNNLDITSEFVPYTWATINLEKVNVPTWPTNGYLPDLFKKYGDRLRIKVWPNTDVITIESRDPKLSLQKVLKEFEISTSENLLNNETEVQINYRL